MGLKFQFSEKLEGPESEEWFFKMDMFLRSQEINSSLCPLLQIELLDRADEKTTRIIFLIVSNLVLIHLMNKQKCKGDE